jgi:NitT/TauT family transport system permease protein
MRRPHFHIALAPTPPLMLGDGLILLALAGLLYVGARLALAAPATVTGAEISLAPQALPWNAAASIARMGAAYALSLAFGLAYGYWAAHDRRAERVLMPLLDVLQSVPILSFLPVVLLSLSAVLPANVAAEFAAIVLIFTSQAWNITFSFYQSVKTVPRELHEAAAGFGFGRWFRFKYVELPFAGLGLVWNSMMSWAGGWFFLMAAEMFTVGSRDFRLPGLGSYLQSAAHAGDLHAVLLGVAALVAVIVALDQLVWRPLLAWAQRFRLDSAEPAAPPHAWLRDVLARAWLVQWFRARVWYPMVERIDARWQRGPAAGLGYAPAAQFGAHALALFALVAAAVVYGGVRAAQLLATLPAAAWMEIAVGLGATLLRVCAALAIAAAWTIPAGLAIGTSPRLAAVLQPVVQVAASVPATALFPIVLLAVLHLPGGLDISAVALMLLGTQWYLLFNVIAGATAIPRELRDTAAMLKLTPAERWRVLWLPALFPYIVTGAITAVGGAWNASIVAEYVEFAGTTYFTVGIGATIARATAAGDYALLAGATLAMVLTVVLLNRLFWLRLYRLAEARLRLE